MAPRRTSLLVLSALALILTSFAIAPRPAEAQAGTYIVDRTDDQAFDAAAYAITPTLYCQALIINDCSLRQALELANRDQIASTINFDASVFGTTQVIQINEDQSTLLINQPNLTIDAIASGQTQLRVRIDGGGQAVAAFHIDNVSGVTIKGLSVTNFSGDFLDSGTAVLISGSNATANRLEMNYLGVHPDGVTLGANYSGVTIQSGASGNFIINNTIGGNVFVGIDIRNASNNIVESNLIGLGPNDTPLFNGQAGVIIRSDAGQVSSGNRVGGTASASANVISGNGPSTANDRAGIVLRGVGTTGNFIRANRIGLDFGSGPNDGITAVRNRGDGIRIEQGASSNELRSTVTAPLVVSGNSRYGIRVTGSGTNNNLIRGVYVGLDIFRNTAVSNQMGGIRIDSGAANTRIESNEATLELTLIAGHTDHPGLEINGASGTRVSGNAVYIGSIPNPAVANAFLARPNRVGVQLVNATGSQLNFHRVGANSQAGVRISGGSNTEIYDSTILGNGDAGIDLIGGGTVEVRDSPLTTNGGPGLRATNVVSATIQGAEGLISENGGGGVVISGGSKVRLLGIPISANNPGIGVLVNAQAAETFIENSTIVGHTSGGVFFDTARLSEMRSTVINNNGLFGLRLNATETTTVRGSTIGLNRDRNSVRPNTGPGIELLGAIKTFIVDDNHITGNTGLGLHVNGGSEVELRGSSFGLYRDPTNNALLVAPNGGVAQVLITNAATHVMLNNNRLAGNATAATDPAGLRIEGDATLMATRHITATLNQIGQLVFGEQTFNFPHGDAIVVNGARDVTIGGATTSERNLIRENRGAAIRLVDTFDVEIRNNARDLVLDGANASEAIFKNQGGGIVVATSGNPPPAGPPTFDSQLILIENNQLAENTGDAIAILGNETLPWLADLQLLNNFLRANTGNGIFVSGNVDRASFRGNLLRANGGPIRLAGTTRYNPNTEANPGDANLPNHDIDPPWVNVGAPSDSLRLRLTDQGRLEGYVITSTNRFETQLGPASACVTCTVQVFRPLNPTDPKELGQGGVLVATSADLGSATEASFAVNPDTGFFSRQLFDNPPNNTQLLLVATDGFVNGNSSEYATFPISRGLVFEPLGATTPGTLGSILTLPQNAAPGAVLTFTMQLRNLGSLTMTGLTLNASGLPSDWGLVSDPPLGTTLPQLVDGAVQPVTITLTLPTGSATSIRAGTLQRITITARNNIAGSVVTAQANLEVRMLARPLLSLSPLTSTRSAPPGFSADHLYVVRNDGNITVTVNFAAVTSDSTGPTTLWTTTLSKQNATIGPGAEDSLRVTVLVPPGTAEGVSAETSITATVLANPAQGYDTITRTATATTRASLAADAILLGGDDTEAVAGAVVPFRHRVVNLSNGTAVFCVSARANKLSTVSFTSATSGFVISPNGCFTLDTGDFREAEFIATVTVDLRLLPGELETINLELRKAAPDGELIGDATATNTILITRGLLLPRVWLPLVVR